MPFARNSDLPANVRNPLPAEAQTVWRRTFNAVLEESGSEDEARQAAWAQVKRQGWEKGRDGKWRKVSKIDKRFETCSVAKIDDELGVVFGWANANSEFTPDGQVIVEDAHGDLIEDDVLEPAVYEFVAASRGMDQMHDWERAGDLVECAFISNEKLRAMFPGQPLPYGKRGMWVGFRPHSDEVLQKFKDGTYTAFSIGGKAIREAIDDA